MKIDLQTAAAIIGIISGIMTWIMFAYWLRHRPR